MGRKKHSEVNSTVFQQANALIVHSEEIKDQELGFTKDGRRRWKRRPKGLIKADRFEIAAALRLQGQTWAQIAEILGVSENACRNWTGNTDYQDTFGRLLAAYKEEQRALILSMVPDAIHTLHGLLNDRSGHVRYEAAQALIMHAALDSAVEKSQSADYFTTEIEKLRKKSSGPQVQVNVMNQGGVVQTRQINEPAVEGEVREV